MPVTLTIRDETASGRPLNELSLDFLTERITVRELIRSRVYQEVKDHNVRAAVAAQTGRAPAYRGLVQPDADETALTAAQPKPPREIDWKRQFEVALDAFARNAFVILLDDRQLKELDEPIEIRPGGIVSFVKLTPLVGG